MKNFSDLPDIKDQSISIEIALTPIMHNGIPYCNVRCNDKNLFDEYLDRPFVIATNVPLIDDINIVIELAEKKYHPDKETAISIDSISVDGIGIQDHCYDLIEYHNDQDVDAKTMYLGFNGRWILSIPGPFYQWWHEKSGQGWLIKPVRA